MLVTMRLEGLNSLFLSSSNFQLLRMFAALSLLGFARTCLFLFQTTTMRRSCLMLVGSLF